MWNKLTACGDISRNTTVAATIIFGCLATVAEAQKKTHPPEETSLVPQWVCLVVFTGFIIAIAFKNPKRTHQT